MGKRTAYEANTKGASHSGRDSKRQRVNGSLERDSPHPNGDAEEVTSARQLQQVLLFDQSYQNDFRHGRRD